MAVIQVGTIAYRNADGEFLPSRPIMRDVPEVTNESKFLPQEDALTEIFLEAFKEYEKTQEEIRQRHEKRMEKLHQASRRKTV